MGEQVKRNDICFVFKSHKKGEKSTQVLIEPILAYDSSKSSCLFGLSTDYNYLLAGLFLRDY